MHVTQGNSHHAQGPFSKPLLFHVELFNLLDCISDSHTCSHRQCNNNKALSVRVCVSNWMDHSVKLFWSLVNIALELPVICLPACGLHPNVSLSESAKEVAAEFKRLQTKVVQRGPCQEINRRSSTLMKRTLQVCGSEKGLLSSRQKKLIIKTEIVLCFLCPYWLTHNHQQSAPLKRL